MTATSSTTSNPRGRAAVSEALLAAAAELFAQKGPRGTSVREIAAAAGVNHGLVHQYFGSKDQLLRASLERLAHSVSDRLDVAGGATVDDVGFEHEVDLHWRALARALLDGEDPATLQREHPVMDLLVTQARRGDLDDLAARRVAAHVVALELGWRLFHGFITTALDLEDDESLRSDLLAAAWEATP